MNQTPTLINCLVETDQGQQKSKEYILGLLRMLDEEAEFEYYNNLAPILQQPSNCKE
jgi:hypothetical protein